MCQPAQTATFVAMRFHNVIYHTLIYFYLAQSFNISQLKNVMLLVLFILIKNNNIYTMPSRMPFPKTATEFDLTVTSELKRN